MTKPTNKSDISLNEAMAKFVSERSIERVAAKDPGFNTSTLDLWQKNSVKLPENVREEYNALGEAFNSLQVSGKFAAIKKQLLVQKLREGTLVAYGFPVHEKSAQSRVSIPTFMFRSEFINTTKSEIVGYDRKFVDVIVSRASKIIERVTEAPKPKPGRPSEKEKIFSIIKKLEEDGQLDRSLSVKEIGNQIFFRGKLEFPKHFISEGSRRKPARTTIEKAYNSYLSEK